MVIFDRLYPIRHKDDSHRTRGHADQGTPGETRIEPAGARRQGWVSGRTYPRPPRDGPAQDPTLSTLEKLAKALKGETARAREVRKRPATADTAWSAWPIPELGRGRRWTRTSVRTPTKRITSHSGHVPATQRTAQRPRQRHLYADRNLPGSGMYRASAHANCVATTLSSPGRRCSPYPRPPLSRCPVSPRSVSSARMAQPHVGSAPSFSLQIPGPFVLLPITSGPGSLSDISDPLLRNTSPCNEATRFCTGGTAAGTWGLLEFGPRLLPVRPRSSGGLWQRIPEPSAFVLLGVGLAGWSFCRRRRVG